MCVCHRTRSRNPFTHQCQYKELLFHSVSFSMCMCVSSICIARARHPFSPKAIHSEENEIFHCETDVSDNMQISRLFSALQNQTQLFHTHSRSFSHSVCVPFRLYANFKPLEFSILTNRNTCFIFHSNN